MRESLFCNGPANRECVCVAAWCWVTAECSRSILPFCCACSM